jgi:hypothetical protein
MTPPDKWQPIIDQINGTDDQSQKLDLLATMVRMLAVNDMSCLEQRFDELSRKFDACMKKIYIVGVIIAAMMFLGLDAKTIFGLVLKLVK